MSNQFKSGDKVIFRRLNPEFVTDSDIMLYVGQDPQANDHSVLVANPNGAAEYIERRTDEICFYDEPAPEPQLVPWTEDTMPNLPFVVRHKDSNIKRVVIGYDPYFSKLMLAGIKDQVDMAKMLEKYEHVLQDTNRPDVFEPCGTYK